MDKKTRSRRIVTKLDFAERYGLNRNQSVLQGVALGSRYRDYHPLTCAVDGGQG
jgi:hypothetical protein